MKETTATVHTTYCGRYVVRAEAAGIDSVVCRSLCEAYDLLRTRSVDTAFFAQRVPFDEMIGLPGGDDVSYVRLAVPAA